MRDAGHFTKHNGGTDMSENRIETALAALDLEYRRLFDDAAPRALLAWVRSAMERGGVDPDKVTAGEIELSKDGEALTLRLGDARMEYSPDQ